MSFDLKFNYPQIAKDSGFKLRQFRDGPLNWRLIGSMEVERILREQQFENIDAILLYLSEAPLASLLESNILDSGIAKYFILSQLAIQYLIFCRKFLDETVRTLRESLAQAEVVNANLKKVNQEHSNEILQLHTKISQIEAINELVFPCHKCTKNFVSNDALNIHLNKKHVKNFTGDIQGNDNDRALINTIKLELEIKQLKERLNTAEKDIRESVEGKKESPIEIPGLSSSTQINIVTKDVGTQSNLSETKETDSSEDVTPNKHEILPQLQEKISKLEIWLETHHSGNQQSINEIIEKLSAFTKSHQSKTGENAKNLSELAKDVILSSIASKQVLPVTSEELLTILSNSVSKVLNVNTEKLNEILTKIETISQEKLPNLEVKELKGQEILLAKRIHEGTSLPDMTTSLVTQKSQISSPSISLRTYSVERPIPIHYSNEIQSDGGTTDVSQEMMEFQPNDVENLPPSTKNPIAASFSSKTMVKTYEKKLLSYGIHAATPRISVSQGLKIAAQLREHKTSLRKIYPRFYATRNKLKNVLDRLSLKKQLDGQFHGSSSDKVELSVEKSTAIKAKSTSVYQPGKNDTFKMRLEKILSSPVKKPTSFFPTVPKEAKKPIPMPRKHVSFISGRRDEDSLNGEHK